MFGIDDLLAGGASAFSQYSANQANKRLAREQMGFQERMSSTAHQREVEDLRKAGLNPLLSVNAGASSPGGAMATQEPAVGMGVSSARENRRLRAELAMNAKDMQVKDSQVEYNKAQTASTYAGMPTKQFVGGVASDARSLYQAIQNKIRGLVNPSPRVVPVGPRVLRAQSSAKRAAQSDQGRIRWRQGPQHQLADSLFERRP